VGYANLDEDIKARMKAVNAEAERYYVAGRDPYVQQPDKSAASGSEGTKEQW
jgi:hypothetical protein